MNQDEKNCWITFAKFKVSQKWRYESYQHTTYGTWAWIIWILRKLKIHNVNIPMKCLLCILLMKDNLSFRRETSQELKILDIIDKNALLNLNSTKYGRNYFPGRWKTFLFLSSNNTDLQDEEFQSLRLHFFSNLGP